MIKYRLICKDCNINFDSWFAKSSEYEKLKRKNFLNCHSCNSIKIEKTLMTPSVVNKKEFLNEKIQQRKIVKIKKKLNEYQKFIRKNFEFVGKNFAYEARSIHYKNKNVKKGIYGKATKEELKELKKLLKKIILQV